MSKQLYKFSLDYGRMGDLDGLFISTEADFNNLMGKQVDFGEVLGKHSCVEATMKKDMFEVIDVPTEVLEILEEKIGITISGYNPFDYLDEEEE